jgi:hypothetical protein
MQKKKKTFARNYINARQKQGTTKKKKSSKAATASH